MKIYDLKLTTLGILLCLFLLNNLGITQPIDNHNYHGSVKSVTIEKVALSDKLRHWFSGPEIQALLVTEQDELDEAVKQETIPGTLYEQVFVNFNESGDLESIRTEWGDQSLKSNVTIEYASGLVVRKHIEGELNGLHPEVRKIYDDEHNLIKESIYTENGELKHYFQYSYPSTDTVKKIKYDQNDQVVEYLIDTYNNKRQLIESTKFNNNDELQVKHTYEYDEAGNMVEERIINKKEQTTGLFKYQYDQQGNCIGEQFITLIGGAEISKEYRYNSYGDPIWYYSWGRKGDRLDREEYVYKYDPQGNWITKITYEIRHDYYGRVIKSPITAEYRQFNYSES